MCERQSVVTIWQSLHILSIRKLMLIVLMQLDEYTVRQSAVVEHLTHIHKQTDAHTGASNDGFMRASTIAPKTFRSELMASVELWQIQRWTIFYDLF